MNELRLVCHNHPDFPGSFAIRLESDGKLLGIGKNAAQTATVRALEEGLATDETQINLRFSAGKPYTERAIVGDIRKGKKPEAIEADV